MITKLGLIDKKGYPLFVHLGDSDPVTVNDIRELKTALSMLRGESPLRITDAGGEEVYSEG